MARRGRPRKNQTDNISDQEVLQAREQAKTVLETLAKAKFKPAALKNFAERIFIGGFVPETVLYEEFGPVLTTQGLALLYNTYRVLVRLRRPWTDNVEVMGYRWSDDRWSKSMVKGVPPELDFLIEMIGKKLKYHSYQPFKVECIWTSMILGAHPTPRNGMAIEKKAEKKTTNGEEKEEKKVFDEWLTFERNYVGDIYIPAYCLRAMARTTLAMMGKEQALAQKLNFASIVLHNPKLGEKKMPIIDRGTQMGKGINLHETIEAGTRFIVEAFPPSSMMSHAEFMLLLQLGGKYVRCSPAVSRGYGDFEVLS